MKKSVVKILVCCHKPGEWPTDDIYLPIQCGKAISPYDLGIQGDDTGDNISAKNPNYCELTALYWAWKNLKDVDYIGLCHYRRYFNFQTTYFPQQDCIVKKSIDNLPESFSINKILQNKDFILPKPITFQYSIEQQYRLLHINEDLDILQEVITEKYPSYLSAYNYIMRHSNKLSGYNMFITRKEIFDSYCQWLFDILFTVEQRIHISVYPYQQRVFGFMGERLLNVYCYHHQYKTSNHQIYFIDDKVYSKPRLYWLRWIYVNFLFRLNRLFKRV